MTIKSASGGKDVILAAAEPEFLGFSDEYQMAHPTRFERVTFAFGGQGWIRFPCLPEISWNYHSQVVS
jgi:hypothetical protein